MTAVAACLVPLGCIGAGHSLIRALRLKPGLNSGGELAVRFLLGSGLVSLIVFALYLKIPRFALQLGWWLSVVLAVVWFVDVARRPRLHRLFEKARQTSPLELALLGLVTAETGLLGRAIWLYGADYDAVAIWALKARELVTGGTPAALLQDSSRIWSHPQYPLSVPIDLAVVLQGAGGVDFQAGKALFVAFAFALVLLFQSLAALRRGSGTSALYCLLLLGVPWLVASALPIAADLPVSALLLGGVAFLWLWLDEGGNDRLLLAALFLGLALWTKRDPIPIWLGGAAIVATAAVAGRYRPHRQSALELLTYALPAVPAFFWYAYAARLGAPDPDFASFSAGWVLGHLSRFPTVIGALAPYLLNGYFGLTWILLGIAVLRPAAWTRGMALTLLLVVIQLAAVAFVYVFSTWSPLAEHVTSSFPRVELQVLPLALLLLLERFGGSDLREGLLVLGSLRRRAFQPRSA